MTKTRDLANLGGGFIQAGTGAVQRTVESKLQDVVSVLDFIPQSEHAAIKNGTSTYNATAAIQAAIDYAYTFTGVGPLYTGGATVFFPHGIYKLGATLTTKSGVNLYAERGTIFTRSTNYGNTFVLTNAAHCSFENIFIYATPGSMTTGAHIRADISNVIRIHNCELHNAWRQIELLGCGSCDISNCKLQHANDVGANSAGIYCDKGTNGQPGGGHTMTNTGIICGGPNPAYADHCLRLESNDGFWITNSYFMGARVANIQAGSNTAGTYTSNTTIIGGMSDHNEGHGVRLMGLNVYHFKFDGRISGLNLGLADKNGIRIEGACTDVTFSGAVDGYKGSSVYVANYQATQINFTSLNIVRSISPAIPSQPNINLLAGANINITGCQIDGASTTDWGIVVTENAYHVVISGTKTYNHIVGGIDVKNNAVNTTVTGCSLLDPTPITVGSTAQGTAVTGCGKATNIVFQYTLDPGGLNKGDAAFDTRTVTGAALGDFVRVSSSVSLQGMTLSAYVSAANTVMVVLTNNISAYLDLPSMVITIEVIKKLNRP